jgi:hypothetical protein
MDEDAQIGSDGVVVGEVPGDDGEDGPAMETAHTAWLVRSRRRRVIYVACRGRCSSQRGTAEAGKPAEYRDASESAVMAGVEEVAGVESMSLSE